MVSDGTIILKLLISNVFSFVNYNMSNQNFLSHPIKGLYSGNELNPRVRSIDIRAHNW